MEELYEPVKVTVELWQEYRLRERLLKKGNLVDWRLL